MAEGFKTPEDGHSHQFKVKFKPRDLEEYTIYCDQPRTVLEAIKLIKKYNQLNYTDENIIIQLGKADKEFAISTHFPCSCIEDGELLIISCESEKVEDTQNKPSKTVHPRNKYSVFYIDREGGKNTKTKELFRSTAIKKFKYLCVYGEKGMTVEEALKGDGRFINDLGDFKLSDNNTPDLFTEHMQKVDSLDKNKFKLCLPRTKMKAKGKKLQEKPGASSSQQHQRESVSVLAVAERRGTSVDILLSKSDVDVSIQEIYEKLCQQYPSLKELMELKMEAFGKIQKSFNECHRVENLLKLGKSVCKVVVGNVCGTGFVLFDNFILTSAHLFISCVEENKKHLQEGITVFALFNYDRPEPYTDYHCFSVKRTLIDFSLGELKVGDIELDYAVLELNPEGQTANQTAQTVKVPAGLLKTFGPLPPNGEACIIGHPKGEIKQMDPTYIIEKENRGQAVDNHLEQFRDFPFIVHLISQVLIDQGIKNILIGGNKADKVLTYNTFMYHGSSGSPVFDARGRVFGLHTGGFVYQRNYQTESVIECAYPILTIFERLVTKIKVSGNKDLMKRVEEEAKGNSYLKTVFESVKLCKSSRVEEEEKSNSDCEMEVEVETEK